MPLYEKIFLELTLFISFPPFFSINEALFTKVPNSFPKIIKSFPTHWPSIFIDFQVPLW